MKILLKIIGILFLLVFVLVGIWFYLDSDIKCKLIYGKNICNFYKMMNTISSSPENSDFEKAMQLCREMEDVPKKDSCFEYIAQVVSFYNPEKAKEACNEIKEFNGVHSKEGCYSMVEKSREEGLRVYAHPVYGYSITIPEDWKRKYLVEENDRITSFVYNSSSELKHNLFSIVVYSNNEWQQIKNEPGYHGNEITSKDNLVFVSIFSLDNPYVGEEGDEYQKMAGDVNNIIKTFKLTESTDFGLLSARIFVRNYLDAYQDLHNKKNFDEVKSYISEKQKKLMIDENVPLETNFTDFDRYEIIKISKSENDPPGNYVVDVKLYKNDAILQNPAGGDTMKIYIIEENGRLKTSSWYFTP